MSKTYTTMTSLPQTLTLLPTYQCTAECADCCFHSSPRITKRIPQERLLRYIDEGAEFPGMSLIVISGGEPFILRGDLVELIQRITDHGLLSRIVTNGYWGVNDKGALATLRPLVAAGLRELSFSTGTDHAQFVPVERVLTAMNAALYLGIGVALMIESRVGGTVTRKTVLQKAAERFPDLLTAMTLGTVSVNESPWMSFTPETATAAWNRPLVASPATLPARHNCSSILWSITVTPDEKLGMCCGLPREDIADLNVGDLRTESMGSLFARHMHDILKLWLAAEGPERILAWAATKDPEIDWQNKYAHMCDACRGMYNDPRVMKVIAEHGSEKFESILTVIGAHAIPLDDGQIVPSHDAMQTMCGSSKPKLAPIPLPLSRRRNDGTVEQLGIR